MFQKCLLVFAVFSWTVANAQVEERMIDMNSINADEDFERDSSAYNPYPSQLDMPESLSILQDWAIQFDNELGRGDDITEHKKIELENNMIEIAEMLHFFPEGAIPKKALPPVHEHSSNQRRSKGSNQAPAGKSTSIKKELGNRRKSIKKVKRFQIKV